MMTTRSTRVGIFLSRKAPFLATKPQAVRLSNGRRNRQYRFRSSRKAVWLLIALFVISIGSTLIKLLRKPPTLPATTAKSISDNVYEWVSQHHEIIVTDPLTSLVSQTGNRLSQNFKHDNIEWKFFVVRNNEMPTYALPDGSIFLRNDSLLLVKHIDDLAALLAHQMAHVALGHVNERIAREFDKNMWAALTPESEDWLELLRAINITGEDADFGRKQERLADELALEMMGNSCFQANRLPYFWKNIRESDNVHAAFIDDVHPHSSRSISKLEYFIENNGPQYSEKCAQQ